MADLLVVFVCHTALKLLLVPAYRSTDFEVHRNWLSLTASLPLREWYRDEASPWTLDYPPGFAYFERALASVARLFDARMLERSALGYASWRTVLFQRLSVMATDAVLYAGVASALAARPSAAPAASAARGARGALLRALPFALVVCDAGLLLIDHVHFQYNGMLLGVLALAVGALERRAHARGAFWFACLLQLKHLYLLAAPLFFVQLLSAHCCAGGRFRARRFAELGAIVLAVFGCCLGPFASEGCLLDVARRLFPFESRGLTHTYWAPNVWALYNAADCAAVLGARALRAAGLAPAGGRLARAASLKLAHMSGTVEPEPHALLPAVSPVACALLVLALNAPVLAAVWARPRPRAFRAALGTVSLAAFLFGWHVHEKAILTPLLCAALGAFDGPDELRAFVLLAAPAHYSLLPLLHEPAERVLRLLVVATHASGCALAVALRDARLGAALTRLDCAYLCGFGPLELVAHWLLPALAGARLPFLPLMLVSVYCAVGVVRAACLTATLYFRAQREGCDGDGDDSASVAGAR
jgi:alpha-1,3-glucosyltransferase